MRGNRRQKYTHQRQTGSIPAYAGEPAVAAHPMYRSPVYPRVCGGTRGARTHRRQWRGLSPRMRGNQPANRLRRHPLRSIPAYAGEPGNGSVRRYGVGVYPRVCGGTAARRRYAVWKTGLSPRMRGNRAYLTAVGVENGSIPAYAGEPPGLRRRQIPAGVYPRVCGGTFQRRRWGRWGRGLSPRMRGNLMARQGSSTSRRSIPAYAGEPAGARHRCHRAGVYPRVCGGTVGANRCKGCRRGLSPRMRGNHLHRRNQRRHTGSIPAYAGEPRRTGGWDGLCLVYPRVCGGTAGKCQSATTLRGLSPRMRGNLARIQQPVSQLGSIPAYAGEPPRGKGPASP